MATNWECAPGPVDLTNCEFGDWAYLNNDMMIQKYDVSTLSLTNCFFHNWAIAHPTFPAVYVAGGVALLSNCDFQARGKLAVSDAVAGTSVSMVGTRLRNNSVWAASGANLMQLNSITQ
jgi:hypothetical protein